MLQSPQSLPAGAVPPSWFPRDGAPPGSLSPRADPGRLHHLLGLAGRAVHAAWGGVGILSSHGELTQHVTWGLTSEQAAELGRSAWLTELLGLVLSRPLPRRLDAPPSPPAALPPAGPFLGVPLQGPGHARAVLYLVRSASSPAFAAADEAAVHPLGAWLEQASLSEEARLQAQLRVVTQVAQAAGTLDLARILRTALHELDRHLPMNVCAVWLLEEGPEIRGQGAGGRGEKDGFLAAPDSLGPGLELADAGASADDRVAALGMTRGMRLAVGETPFGDCLRDGQAFYLDPGSDGPGDTLTRLLAAGGATCSFAVPLRAGDEAVGVLQSICLRPGGFTTDQVQLLCAVGDLLGPAVSHCRLLGRLTAACEELRRAQGQLVQAEKMRALGELAGGVAHEFNNDLCGVLGFLELALLHPNLDPACRGYLEQARACSLEAARTVRRVQDFARWHPDDQAVRMVDLNELVRQTVELVRHKWEGLDRPPDRAIHVELHAEASAWVSGSPAELRDVITNLVFNAVEAMPAGGTLRVRTSSTPREVVLAVQDTGVGIPEAVRHRLFEPFFTTRGDRGSGLGLSAAFGIVRRHGGDITVETAVGQGSTFTVRLPAGPQPEAAVGRAAPAGRPAGGLRVLVVEDEESVRRFLGMGLTRMGHRPRLTADANEGLAALDEEPFDLVLTDLGLPGASGAEVAREVERRRPGTPVLLLTGWADRFEATETPPGVRRVLSKPITLDTLAAALAAVG